MFEITIKGETLEELAGNVNRMAAQFGTTVPDGGDAKPKGKRATAAGRQQSGAGAAPAPSEEPEDPSDAALMAELAEPVEPMPETAKAVVDAGTGAPAGGETVKMTFDDVKAAAAKLAAKDTPKLAEILGTYGAGKISEVPKGKLGDFAADVMQALG
jgi:hypothetical protein